MISLVQLKSLLTHLVLSTKSEIRKRLLKQRETLSFSSVKSTSEDIVAALLQLSKLISATTVLTYVAYKNEVRNHTLIEYLWKHKKTCIVPKVQREKGMLELYEIEQWADLQKGYKGILEPKKHCRKIEELSVIDLCILSGVAFDRQGNRLGYGKGFFDKILALLPPETPRIALAFDFQVVDTIPREKHDQNVHTIITESCILNPESST